MGRGAFAVQVTHRRRAEVTRLVAGSARLLAQEASRSHFKSELLGRLPEVVEHDVHDGYLLDLGRVDLQHRLLVAFPGLGGGAGASGRAASRGGPSPTTPTWSPHVPFSPLHSREPGAGSQEQGWDGARSRSDPPRPCQAGTPIAPWISPKEVSPGLWAPPKPGALVKNSAPMMAPAGWPHSQEQEEEGTWVN